MRDTTNNEFQLARKREGGGRQTKAEDRKEAQNPLGGVQVVIKAANPVVGREFVVEVEIAVAKGQDRHENVVPGTVGGVVGTTSIRPPNGPHQGLNDDKEEGPQNTGIEETTLDQRTKGVKFAGYQVNSGGKEGIQWRHPRERQ